MSKQCCAVYCGPEEFKSIENPDEYFYREVWEEAHWTFIKKFRFYRDLRPNQQLHAYRLAGVIFRMRETLHDMNPTRRWLGDHPHIQRMCDLEDEGL